MIVTFGWERRPILCVYNTREDLEVDDDTKCDPRGADPFPFSTYPTHILHFYMV